jgi:hypothetical protein
MMRTVILRPGAHPDAHRPQAQRTGGCRAGQGRRQPASAASVPLDVLASPPVPSSRRWADARFLPKHHTPTAVLFTLDQDTKSFSS